MGVPKFFRYTSERYPCLNELVKQYQIPDFDNMYLDMNGIIHNCSHPDDSNPHFRISEEKIFRDIFHYINILFQIIKPKKLFFMAIDGVAPRAKMNQQRGRRFRSAREAEKVEEDAKARGEVLPSDKRFDSNCITPGTVFMARLHEQLRYFVKQKMSTDPLWSKVKVILSGHETPGEGEHKIMDYIRWARSQPDYEPNTRHCLYGLDADLIMLGMCTHEPHFALLREEVKFGRTTERTTSPEETNFYLLHLSLLREYLEQEFLPIKDKLPFEYDIEKIVDDWVLMGFLVGNDFIPHLPNMHISNDALPLLYKTYMTVLPTLDGYINEAGDLNLGRFEIFMQELAKIDKEKFQDTYTDLKYFEAKTGRRPNAQERKEYKPNNDETFNVDVNEIKMNKPDDELQALIDATEDLFIEDGADDDDEYVETSDEEANFEQEFILHKKDYYMNKLDYSKVTDEVLADQAEGYVRAIQWNLYYYYKGCPSWCWYYPHHYAPYISDIKGFKDLKIEFELGDPFKPFEQLLAVLPAASKQLLPAPFHDLMTDEDSPIVHYYPVHFETDLNGKRNNWEAVVLIPFIDETNLLSAMAPCYQRLTEEELKRNSHGPMLVYNWTAQNQGVLSAPEYFPAIEECHVTEQQVWRQELDVPEGELVRGMLPTVNRDKVYPGFPTLRHLKYKTYAKKAKVKVFDMPSRNDNIIVELIDELDEEPPLEKTAEELLGKIVWVGWPHLTKAKIISVSNEQKRLHYIENEGGSSVTPAYSTENNNGNLHKQWLLQRATIIDHNMNRLGIELGEVNTIIHAVTLKGYQYVVEGNAQMALRELWSTVESGYARQAIVRNLTNFVETRAHTFSSPTEAYPVGDRVFLLTKGQYYGCMATVVDSSCIHTGRIKVQVCERPEPAVSAPAAAARAPYRSANHAAAACGISTQMLSRITGTVLVIAGERNNLPTEAMSKVNIGLNLKFNKKNQEVAGFTRRCKVTNAWLYSEKCIELVKAYAEKFPELFDKLMYAMGNDVFFESDLWPGEMGEGKPQEVIQWLKTQPHSTALRRECGSEILDTEELKALAEMVDTQLADLKNKEKKVTLHVKWSLLYKAELHEGNVPPDRSADYVVLDRVVCARRCGGVPAGARGTLAGLAPPANHHSARLADRLDAAPLCYVMFDQPYDGALHQEGFHQPRFYRLLPNHLLNISYGRKLRNPPSGFDGQDCFTFQKTPNILRKEDGHHSAFASYSPTSETKGVANSSDNRKNSVNNIKPQVNQQDTQTSLPQPPSLLQDNATQLLKSLLKISENDSNDSKKLNESPKEPNLNINQNWRTRNDSNLPAPPPQRPQKQNWRKENPVYNNNNRNQPQQLYSAEWTNKNYKSQPIVPPFPNFSQNVPVNQIPFPSFQNAHFQQRNQFFGNHGNQDGPRPQNSQQSNRNYGNNSRQEFPKHLPNVGNTGIVSLEPSWIKTQQDQNSSTFPSQNKAKPNQVPSTVEKVANPFVPLQVQTSQRRHQNAHNASTKKDLSGLPAPKPVIPQLQPTDLSHPPQQQEPSKSQKKKRPRIAANLPFQM